MKNYKIAVRDTEDVKFLETYRDLDSGIPEVLVEKINQSLVDLSEEFIGELEVTPMMVDPDTLNLVFGILETTEGRPKLKYSITISKQKQYYI
jgi:hypothetical protein